VGRLWSWPSCCGPRSDGPRGQCVDGQGASTDGVFVLRGLEEIGIIIAWLRLMSVQRDGQTPLHAASSSGNGAVVEDLIAAQAVVDAAVVRRRLQCWALFVLIGVLSEVEWSHLG
jgi:hypothetical protein